MKRRTFGGIVCWVAASPGCLQFESQAFQPKENESNQTPERSEEVASNAEKTERLRTALEAADVAIIELERSEEGFSLRLQTGGTTKEDINRVASAYSTVAETLDADMTVVIEDRGFTEGRFTIKYEWAVDHARDNLSDKAYLQKLYNQDSIEVESD